MIGKVHGFTRAWILLGMGIVCSCASEDPGADHENLSPQPSAADGSVDGTLPSGSSSSTNGNVTNSSATNGQPSSNQTSGAGQNNTGAESTQSGASTSVTTSSDVDTDAGSTPTSNTSDGENSSTLSPTGSSAATSSESSSGDVDVTSGQAEETSSGSGGQSSAETPDTPCEVPDYIHEQPLPIGWASMGGGTTGGGSATPQLVTTLAALKTAVAGSEPRVIYVKGELEAGDITFGSNKTVIGCSPGAHVRGSLSIGSGASNVIVRNLNISGYAVGNCALDPSFDSSEGCSSGKDAVGIKNDAHHVWFDHCSVKDGADGNLDVTNNADFVTISWTKFSYTPRTDNVGNDSTGAAGHRYSNLVGGTDTPPSGWPQTIPLNVTWHHNWWAENVVERQPRVRFGRNHVFNNYYNSGASNYCVRAGVEASILLQGNYFDGVKSPHQFNGNDDSSAFIALGTGALANVYTGTSGAQATGGGGKTFAPPYEFSVESAANIPSIVKAGAGPH